MFIGSQNFPVIFLENDGGNGGGGGGVEVPVRGYKSREECMREKKRQKENKKKDGRPSDEMVV